MPNVITVNPKRICLSVPHISGCEMEFIREAFDRNWLSTKGPNLFYLEREFQDLIGHPSLALNSGTSAIHLALKLVGVRPGQEVVVSTLTFAGSCNPIRYEQAKPIFMDSELVSWNMDPQLLSDFLKKRARQRRLPKAVVVVHIFGQAADMDSIQAICQRYEIPLVEDAAESLGATYKGRLVGSLGEVGAFSLNGNKIVTSSGGGLLSSPHSEWIQKAEFWSTQARDPGLNYLHSEIGYNYRMSNVLAGIARGQLRVLNERIAQRQAVAQRYRTALAALPGLAPMPQVAYGISTNWLSCFTINPKRFGLNPRELIHWLDEANIESRPVWKPLHTQPVFSQFEHVGGGVAEYLNQNGICLPSSSNLSEEDQDRVVQRIIEAHQIARRNKPLAISSVLVRPWPRTSQQRQSN